MEVLSTTRLTNNYRVNLFASEYKHLGKEGTWIYASRKQTPEPNKPDAVVIVPITKEGDIIAIREFRVPLGDYEIGLPAGLIDEGETIEEAAKREMLEETGLSLEIDYVSPITYSSAGLTDESVVFVCGRCMSKPQVQQLGQAEDIKLLIIDSKLAKRLLYSTDVKISSRLLPFLILKAAAERYV